jgi:hypothetical protein
METLTKPIATLVKNGSLWPRRNMSAANTANIREAILAGVAIPPVVADRETLWLIDGWHRCDAYEGLFGPEYEIPVDLRSYSSKAEMLADAISLNIGRGSDLSRWDVTKCLFLAEEADMPLDSLAKLLRWRPERLAKYRESRMGTTVKGSRIALKRSIRHHLSVPLTESQAEANEHLSGMSPRFHIGQLVTLIEADLLPRDDAALIDQLLHLAHLIEDWAATTEQEKGA